MNEKHFIFSGHDTVELAKEFGTPLYVMSEDIIENTIKGIKSAFEKYDLEYDINFAGKAFTNIAMCRLLKKLDVSLDAVSGGELYTALKAGFDPKRICMHGSNKSIEEMSEAIDAGVGTITVDSFYEIDTLGKIAKEKKKVAQVHIRLSPGVEAHTHEYIQTGRVDSKFGIPISMAVRAARKVMENDKYRRNHRI